MGQYRVQRWNHDGEIWDRCGGQLPNVPDSGSYHPVVSLKQCLQIMLDSQFHRFLPADSLFTLAMACNVYLTFFHKYTANQLRALEWKYIAFCYGVPLIPAVVYEGIQTKARGKVYGSATVS